MYIFCWETSCRILRQLLTQCVVVGEVIPIDILPDEVLLAIFDFLVDQDVDQAAQLPRIPRKKEIESWQSLVHVCRRWRRIVFESPHRLNLRLVCTIKTSARDTLDVWPALPLLIRDSACYGECFDNFMALLKHNDRVCQINLGGIPGLHLEKLSAAMQEPFPELTLLVLLSPEMVPALPDSFLGGSAPRLRFLWLEGISFPGLPKLLLSATRLVHLTLYDIPHSGYISPEAMLAALSTLATLESLSLGFLSSQPFPDLADRPPLSQTRSALPVLTYFWYQGASGYLDDLVARIDAPQVNKLYITFFHQIVFHTPQFTCFIRRTPALKALKKAHVAFDESHAHAILSSRYGLLHMTIVEFGLQVSSLERICTSFLSSLFSLEDLYIYEYPSSHPDWRGDTENTAWLELLHPFSAVKNLYLSKQIASIIGHALQDLVGGRTTEVLPTLQHIFLEGLLPSGPIQEGIQQFVAMRQVTSHHIAVSRWDKPSAEMALL